MNKTLLLPGEDIFVALQTILQNNNFEDKSYYQLRNLFNTADHLDRNRLIELINIVIEEQLNGIFKENHLVSLVDYLKIWNTYQCFCQSLNGLLDIFYPILTQIKSHSYSTINTCQILQFYKKLNSLYVDIIEAPFLDPIYLDPISIEELLQYVTSIHQFICLQAYLPEMNGTKLSIILKLAINNEEKIYSVCHYLDALINDLNEYRARELINLVNIYCTGTHFYTWYIKWMQARIISPHYAHLQLEKKLLQSINCFSESEHACALQMIEDVSETSNLFGIDCPIICTKGLWASEGLIPMEVQWPTAIKNKLTSLETIYKNRYPLSNSIEWYRSVGSAVIVATLNRPITVTCHMLQAIVLMHLSEEKEITIDYLQKINLGSRLITKILNSLTSTQILTKINEHWIPNENYSGPDDVDIRDAFLI